MSKSVLLIIGGGVAAYKSLELARELGRKGISVTGLLTKAGAEFITPLSVASLTGNKCYTDLFDLTDEAEMGHIQLSRSADLIVVAPATADLMAKAANGLANDLASTVLLATDKQVLVAPAMNVRMWHHPSTQRNIKQLSSDGVSMVGPGEGDMACGEFGLGRMAEPAQIVTAVEQALRGETVTPLSRSSAQVQQPTSKDALSLAGRHVLITAGPTHEPLDPVRYIANRSSGKQGYALAAAAIDAGAQVTLVSGPTALNDVPGARVIRVETARQMMAACEASLPVDVAILCAAVADYRPEIETPHKIKKERGGLSAIPLAENPDILRTLSKLSAAKRPSLVVGFAAETDDVISHAEAKRQRKGCDWIVANDVSPGTETMGGDLNTVSILSDDGEETWAEMPKAAVATRLMTRISEALKA